MLRLLLRLAVNAIALWVAIRLVDGIGHTGPAWSLLMIALVFGLVNALVRPFLLLLTCPFILLTLGLFTLIVNTLMLWLTAQLSELLGLGLRIEGFWPTFWGALIISVVSGIINLLVRDAEERDNVHTHKKARA
jgi:putative membrane protein